MKMVLVHKWEELGLGTPPYKCVGMFSMPSPKIAEANPTAYNTIMQSAPQEFRIGSCSVCGMGLVNNFLIKSLDGKKFSVGCDCIKKRGDSKLIAEVEFIKKRIAREKRLVKTEEKRKQQLIQQNLILEKERLVNGGLTNAEVAKIAEEKKQTEKREYIRAELHDIFSVIDCKTSDFWKSISESLSKGYLPYGRGWDILMSELSKNGLDSEEMENKIHSVINTIKGN